ncbi:efflux RND transporter periplasmic adaptor subunit [Aestuariivirga sp.]|jgi:HlyD family secretion protein|uniref:efflux RND transporter periplasmic adaptor subunit n=1 Tax=Aestuariivirga sp. TaxID=2650926 RepID=UPI00378475DF
MNIQTPRGETEVAAVLGLTGSDQRHRRRVRLIGFGVGIAILAIAAWLLFRPNAGSAVSYTTAQVEQKTLVVKVQATGNIQPTTQVEVSSERSGVIRSVNVQANSLVKRGDVLAQLDTERLEAELARDKAAVAATEARLADAKATLVEKQTAFRRAERLSSQGISSTADLDTARAAQDRAEAGVIAAQADIAVARAELAMTETDLTKTRILSPVDGIVLKRTAEPGQTVASSLQAPVLFTLAEDLQRMQLEADIDEADIGDVKSGQTASFTVDAYPGQSFPAVIDTVEYSPEVNDNVVTYKAVLTVENDDLLLRPGMTATAQIIVKEVKDVLAVPNAALRYAPPRPQTSQSFSITSLFIPRMPRSEKSAPPPADGERMLYVLEDGQPKSVKVHAGVSDGKDTEILSGELKPGDAVIVSAKAGGS